MRPNYITAQGLQKLKDELTEIKKVKLPAVSVLMANAKAQGDLSENADFTESKSMKRTLDRRSRELEDLIQNAVIMSDTCQNTDGIVKLGCTVKFKDLNKDKTNEYQIVGFSESDPLNGRISNESPIGKALLNRKEGETVIAETPTGTNRYQILEVK